MHHAEDKRLMASGWLVCFCFFVVTRITPKLQNGFLRNLEEGGQTRAHQMLLWVQMSGHFIIAIIARWGIFKNTF